MARSLNLQIEKYGKNCIRISWTDVQTNDQNKALPWIIGLVWFPIWVYSGFRVLASGDGSGVGFFFLLILVLLVAVIWFRGGSTSFPNSITLTPETISHNGREFSTKDVSRFEYGVKSSLTGITPYRDSIGGSLSDPTMVRMWINDAVPYTISENNWDFSVNHQIRDALARALDEVRKSKAKEERAKKFGDQGDLGMPDY